MWYSVLFVVSVSGGNLDSLSVSQGPMPIEACREFAETRNAIMSEGYYTVPGYRSVYSCLELPKLEEVISKHQCSIVGEAPDLKDNLYECKSTARLSSVPKVPAAHLIAPSADATQAETPRTLREKRSSSAESGSMDPSAVTQQQGAQWAIQAGSFTSRATAQALTDELLNSGQPAFLMAVTAGSHTLYRVRIGPFDDRESANNAAVGAKEIVPSVSIVRY